MKDWLIAHAFAVAIVALIVMLVKETLPLIRVFL